MPQGVYGHCQIKFGDDIFYIIGGVGPNRQPNSKVFKWQIGVNWTPLAPLLQSSGGSGCALVDTKLEIVIAGGFTEAWGNSKDVQIYNIVANQWRLGSAVLPGTIWSFLTFENTVWVLGTGERMTYRYDYTDDQWVHEKDIVMSGVPRFSRIVVDTDNTLKCF